MIRNPIVLATDLGPSPYVGIMKGVIATIAPKAQVVDLTHDISPQDVIEGLWHLRAALPYFPKGSIFVAVVDPGVGTARRPICVDGGDVLAVGPDNGILAFIPPEQRRAIHLIENEKYILHPKSATFHGRDLFAPAAAYLAMGLDPAQLGPPEDSIVELPWSLPRPVPDGLEGLVIFVDRFGNLITNIEGTRVPPGSLVTLEKTLIGQPRQRYSDVEPGRPLALVGSSGFIEIALRNGSAHQALRLGKGAKVHIRGAQ